MKLNLAPNDYYDELNIARLAAIGIVAEIDIYVPEASVEHPYLWYSEATEFRGSERSEIIKKHQKGEVAFAVGIRISSNTQSPTNLTAKEYT